MKFKFNFLLFAIFALLAMPACKSDPGTDDGKLPPEIETISVGAKTVSFAAENAPSQSVSITASSEGWYVETQSGAEWLSASRKSTDSGEAVLIEVNDNTDLDSRSAYVYVRLGSASDSVLVTQIGLSPEIKVSPEKFEITADAQTVTLDVVANIDYNVVFPDDCDFITYEIKDNGAQIVFSVAANVSEASRTVSVSLASEDEQASASLEIVQAGADPDERVRVTDDIFIPFVSATTASSASAYPIENINDNNLSTFWQTPSRGVTSPAVITFDFGSELITRLDYLVYYPSTPYGQFGQVDVYYTTGAGVETFLCSHDFNMSDSPDTVRFGDEGISWIKTVTLKVKTANGRESSTGVLAGIAELEFFRTPVLREISEIFTDNSCSELLDGITVETAENIADPVLKKVATELANGTYDSEFRMAEYSAYPHPDEDAALFGTSTYTKWDNITGMCVTQPGKYYIAVESSSTVSIYMDVINWESNFYGSNCDFQLKNGLNVIEIPEKRGTTTLVPGMIYLRIHSANYKNIDPIKIHFLDAEVNGYFNPYTMDHSRFETMLENTKVPQFDIIGRKSLFIGAVETIQKYTRTGDRAQRFMEYMDTVVTLEEDIQGHIKYNTGGHRNRLLAAPAYGGFMFAGSYAVGLGPELQVCDPDHLVNNFWGVAHEVGHCNQIRPGFKWVGTTEVTNNICSAFVTYTMGGGKDNGAKTPLTNSDFFNLALRDIALNPDQSIDHFSAGSWDGMYYEKVVPFWQLYLYYTYVGGFPDLYRDLYNTIRNNNNVSGGAAQINFMKLVCDLTKTDLTEFFEFWRMLSPTQGVYINDYGSGTMTITQDMVDELKSHISQYAKPKHKIQFICESNIDNFLTTAAPVAGTMSKLTTYVRSSGFSGIVAYELCDGPDKTVAYYLPTSTTATGFALYNRYSTLIWMDSNGNPSPGNVNSSTYYCSKNTVTTISPANYNPYVYGITASGERIPATNNPQ